MFNKKLLCVETIIIYMKNILQFAMLMKNEGEVHFTWNLSVFFHFQFVRG